MGSSHFAKRLKVWEGLQASAADWRKKANVLQRENQTLRDRVAELEKALVDLKYRQIEGRLPGRGR